MSNKLLFINQVEAKTSKSRMTLRRWWEAGTFPKPTKIGRENAWLESTIDNWIDDVMVKAEQQT